MKSIILVLIVGLLVTGCTSTCSYEELESERFNFYSEDYICNTNLEAMPLPDQDEFVITTQEEYDELIALYEELIPCDKGYYAPDIDFEQYSLLGRYASGGGCTIDFVKTIYKDETNKQIIYKLVVDEQGLCEMAAVSMNWILVPTIPEGYEVVFN